MTGKTKRAAIYVRTSSEQQGQKASPQEQEKDCRAYCTDRGYRVVKVYCDIERYRVGNKLVEPSGTRSDRPGFRQILADGAAGLFDVIVAWREDRLYRGLRPMLDVIDCIEAHKLDVELVKETFDRKMAPVKAWVGRMELDAKQERTEMGMAARLAQGKPMPVAVRYGYALESGRVVVNPDEAKWVKSVWTWYADGVPNNEIRRRLIEGNAPQRKRVRIPWEISVLGYMLRAECYYTGFQVIQWAGQTYKMPVPIIIEAATAKRVAERRERNKTHPAHHLKYDYLGLGVMYCAACNKKMASVSFFKRVRKDGTKAVCGHYICRNHSRRYHMSNCAREIGAKMADGKLWEKLWDVLSNDELFEDRIRARVDALKEKEADAGAEIERLQRELARLAEERQWVITKGRKHLISDEEIEGQLAQLNTEEAEVKHEIAEKSVLVGDTAERLVEFANNYRRRVRGGADWLNRKPRSAAEAEKQFAFRREVVEAIVRRVDVYPDKSIKVHLAFEANPRENNPKQP